MPATLGAFLAGFLTATALSVETLPLVFLAGLFVEATIFHFLEDAFPSHHPFQLRDCSCNVVSVYTYLNGSELNLFILFVLFVQTFSGSSECIHTRSQSLAS